MILIAAPDVPGHVAERGGRLYVWAKTRRCCSGQTTFLESATEKPDREFALVADDGFEVWLDTSLNRTPEELHVELRGRRNRRPVAYWDGCAYVA